MTIHREPGQDALVSSPVHSGILEVPDFTIEAIRTIDSSPTVGEAERRLEAAHGEAYDLLSLVAFLHAKGFVRSIDDAEVGAGAAVDVSTFPLNRIRPETAAFIRHPLVIGLSAALILQYAVALFFVPAVRPSREWLTGIPGSQLLAMLTLVVGMLGLAYVHELAHFLVARSYGVNAKIGVTHRLYMWILKTDVTEAWTLPKGPRIAIFSAGIVFNLAAMGALGIPLQLEAFGLVGLGDGMRTTLQMLIFASGYPLVFQLWIPARTDLYYILEAWLGVRNLGTDAPQYVKMVAAHRFRRIAGRDAGRLSCGGCGDPTFVDEPFCIACGEAKEVSDPNRYAFRYEARRALLTFGVVSTLTMLLLGPFILFATWLFSVLTLGYWTQAMAAFDAGATGQGLQSAVLALLFAGQVAFFALMIARASAGFTVKGYGALVRAFPALPRSVQGAVAVSYVAVVSFTRTRVFAAWKSLSSRNRPATLVVSRNGSP